MQFCGQLNMTWWFWRRFLNGLNVRLSLSLSEGNENEDSFLAYIKTDRQTDGNDQKNPLEYSSRVCLTTTFFF